MLLARSLLGYVMAIDPVRSVSLYAEAIACAERSGDHFTEGLLHSNAACNALEAGDIPAARAHLEAAAQAGQQIGREDIFEPANLGLVQRAEGDHDRARSTLEAALRTSRRNGDSRGIASACLYLACLAGDLHDGDRAAVLHGFAQAVQDRAGIPWEEYAARYRRDSLGQARAHLGDEQLQRAYAQGMTLSLEQALDLALPQAGPAPSPQQPQEPPGLGKLTARERELVTLVAQGHTDAQIAAQLYISVRTVRSHLDRIRDKTGCRRRADLTRLALHAGLV